MKTAVATALLASASLLAACCELNPAHPVSTRSAQASAVSGNAADRAAPLADPVPEAPTLRSLGAYWVIKGDANKNAVVSLEYRRFIVHDPSKNPSGSPAPWKKGANLFRVEKGAHTINDLTKRQEASQLKVPEDAWLFAGSALLLEPNTAYELKLTLHDPDGGDATKTLRISTIGEPVQPGDLKTFHVVPGDGGGTGTENDPFKGLAAADAAARPGSLFLLRAGNYSPVVLKNSGEPGKPIIYRAADPANMPVVLGLGDEQTKRAIDATEIHDLWLERLAVTNAHNGIVLWNSARIVIRRCKITNITYGINGAPNDKMMNEGFFISDNTILGPSVWPRAKGIEEARGIQISGRGHVVCYNFVKAFADAIDTYQGPVCEAIDFHNNECQLLTDDGCELDFSERNTRCFENRFTNAYQGISTQPVFGGPVYIFRNVVYNIEVEPFKIHNSPSGVLIFHNTLVKNGEPAVVMTPAEMHNFISRNNLYVGNGGECGVQPFAGEGRGLRLGLRRCFGRAEGRVVALPAVGVGSAEPVFAGAGSEVGSGGEARDRYSASRDAVRFGRDDSRGSQGGAAAAGFATGVACGGGGCGRAATGA